MKQFWGLLLLMAIVNAPVAGAAEIREDMVALDRACVPALVLSSAGQADLADKAMRVARSRWGEFKERYYNAKTADAGWRKDLDRVDALIWEAHAITDGGRQVALAREPLERVNTIMAELRRRNGMDHYFDRVWAFREPLNAIVGAARRKAPPEDAVNAIRASFATAQQAWERVLADKPGVGYRLTSAERDRLQARLDAETAALAALGRALTANDRAAIIAAAAALETPFAETYNSFGDFHALMWEESKAR